MLKHNQRETGGLSWSIIYPLTHAAPIHSTSHTPYEHLRGGASCGVPSTQTVTAGSTSTHTHTGGSFIITVTKSRKLDASSCLSTATTKHQTALPLRINIGIRSCQPQAANTTTLTLRDDREVKELRTSSSLMCPPVHKKVFQEQKRKIVNHRR